MGPSAALAEELTFSAFRIPTDAPESDGTLAWDATTLVVAEIRAAGETGLGYSYASVGACAVGKELLAAVVDGADVFDTPRLWLAMVTAVRNAGWRGVCACAISAVDVALWDLKAKLLKLPLARLLGASRSAVPIYGSGGFCSYSDDRLREQLSGWVTRDGCRAVKMKVGREPGRDLTRVEAARGAIGDADLYIDANGAFDRQKALGFAEACRAYGVTWFEEPVSSDDLEGLRLLRERMPARIDVVAGEYGYEPFYFRRMLEAGAVDILQADATRCGGVTGFLKAAAIADAFGLPLSAHTAPALHLHPALAAPRLVNVEWFHDHVRIERMLFDGAPRPRDGEIRADFAEAGLGLLFKRRDAEQFRV